MFHINSVIVCVVVRVIPVVATKSIKNNESNSVNDDDIVNDNESQFV